MILDESLWASLRNGCDEEVSWPGFLSPLLSSNQGDTFWFVLKFHYVDEKLVAYTRKKDTNTHVLSHKQLNRTTGNCSLNYKVLSELVSSWWDSVLLELGEQSCHLIKTDGGDWNHEKPYKVQNNTFKEKHTNIRVAVINWATKVVWCSGRNGQFTMVGKCPITRCCCFFHLRKMQLSQASFRQVCNKWLHFRIKF